MRDPVKNSRLQQEGSKKKLLGGNFIHIHTEVKMFLLLAMHREGDLKQVFCNYKLLAQKDALMCVHICAHVSITECYSLEN